MVLIGNAHEVGVPTRTPPNNLRAIRTIELLSVSDLSRLSAVNENTMRDIERGRIPGCFLTRQKLVKALQLLEHPTRQYTYEDVFPELTQQPATTPTGHQLSAAKGSGFATLTHQ